MTQLDVTFANLYSPRRTWQVERRAAVGIRSHAALLDSRAASTALASRMLLVAV